MTAAWSYNSDGTVRDVAYAGVKGAAYAARDVVYGANGKPASATYWNGMTAIWAYNVGGGYQIAYTIAGRIDGVASPPSSPLMTRAGFTP